MQVSRESANQCMKAYRFMGMPSFGRAFEICITKHSLACVNTGLMKEIIELDDAAADSYRKILAAYSSR